MTDNSDILDVRGFLGLSKSWLERVANRIEPAAVAAALHGLPSPPRAQASPPIWPRPWQRLKPSRKDISDDEASY